MKKLLSILLTLLLLASCSQEELGTPFYAGQEVSISAALSSSNNNGGPKRISGKDNVDKIDLTWDANDQILVTVGDKSAVFTLTSGAGTNNATFMGKMPADGSNFHVSYPIDYTDEVLTNQTYTANGFGTGLMKMSTKIPGTLDDGFMLSADNALLGLQLSGDVVISKIVVTNMDNNKTYTLDCSKQEIRAANGRLFYIVLPATTWSSGMKVYIYNADGDVIETKEKNGAITFSADNAMVMPEVEVYNTKEFEVNGVMFRMVYVEAGTFMMGSDESSAPSNTKPAHAVTLSDYYIGQTEVTRELWKAVMGNIPNELMANKMPVGHVTWEDCQIFLDKLSKLTEGYFRLPTEAEWEYAAKGGTKSKGFLYSGSNNPDEIGWTNYLSNGTQITAQKQPNELGIYDMTGNAWEWCMDGGLRTYGQSISNPIYDGTSTGHVIRGGSFRTVHERCTNIARSTYGQGKGDSHISLRLVLDTRNSAGKEKQYFYGFTDEQFAEATSEWKLPGMGWAIKDQTPIQGKVLHGVRLKVAHPGSFNLYKASSPMEKSEANLQRVSTITTTVVGLQDIDFTEPFYLSKNEYLVVGCPSDASSTTLKGNHTATSTTIQPFYRLVGSASVASATSSSLMLDFY